MESMGLLMDVLMAFFGAYFIYSAVTMKSTGEIRKGIMVSKNLDLSRATDIPGFIEYMFLKTIVVGVLTAICGGVGIYNDLYGGISKIYGITMIVFFFILVIYGFLTVRAQKKFLGM